MTVHFEDILQSDPTAEICVLGDFNVHNTEWLPYSSHTDTMGRDAEFFSITNNFSQLVSTPTRVPDRDNDTAQTLDLFLTTHPSLYTVSNSAPVGSSDHCLLTFTQSSVSIPRTSHSRRVFWNYASADWDGMRQFFSSYPWKCCFSADPSTFALNITNVLMDGMLLFIPHCLKPGKHSSPEWFNHACLRAVKRKNRLYRRWRNNPTSETRQIYIAARNTCSKVIDLSKERFIRKKAYQLLNAPSGSRTFWSMAKAVCRNFCYSSFPPIVDSSGCPKFLPSEKANIFAEIFSSNSIQTFIRPPLFYPPHSSNFAPPTIIQELYAMRCQTSILPNPRVLTIFPLF